MTVLSTSASATENEKEVKDDAYKSALVAGIAKLASGSGDDGTHVALAASQGIFGAGRPWNQGFPKVLVLITSDQFANPNKTIEEALKLQALRYVQVWVVLFIKDKALYKPMVVDAIASKPSCTHVVEIYHEDMQISEI